MPNNVGVRLEQAQGPDCDTLSLDVPRVNIPRLGTARAAFVGRTLRGPVNRPVFLKSFAQFQNIFGGLWQPSPLSYALQQFFDNGGREAVVVRVVNGARAATLSLPAGPGFLRLRAIRPGTREFLRACVDYDNIAPADATEFNLTVQRVRALGTEQVEDQEIFSKMSLDPGAERHVRRLLAESELIELEGEVSTLRPDKTVDAASGLATRYVASNADGDDGAPLTDYDLIGSQIEQTGLFALDSGESFNFLCIPPLSRRQDVGRCALLVAARFCKERRALLIVDPPSDWLTADDALRGARAMEFSCDNALMYFPRILAHDTLRGQVESFAPCGAVAGMLARLDETYPVWGSVRHEEAVLRPGFRPSCLVTEDVRRRLAAVGVNTLQAARSAARVGVAPRTLAAKAAAADWRNLAARRLALFILNCVERGTRWVQNTENPVAAELVSAQVQSFFKELQAAGCWSDRPPDQAFYVICDERLNRAHDSSTTFQLLIGFAGSRRHAFHSFRIMHSATGAKVLPATLNRLNGLHFSAQEIEWVNTLASQLLATPEPPC